MGNPVVAALGRIQPDGQVVEPGLPWQAPESILKNPEGQGVREQVRPETLGP